ncbi:MAG: hypothetical protein RL748_1369 [Pseudomonadota bacterium]|jgi:hypothetical protein
MPSKQLNIQQQNSQAEAAIRKESVFWRQNAIPVGLHTLGCVHGVDWARSIIVDLEIDFPGMPELFGLLLTQDERFIQFEIETDASHSEILHVACWQDVTPEQNINPHNRGIGAGPGALALKVLRALNTPP